MDEQTHVYDLTFEERSGYLYARITADTNSDEMVAEYIGKIVDHCRRHDHCKVMIDRHIPRPLTNTAAYLMMSEICDKVEGDVRLAVVAHDHNNRLRLEFGAHVVDSDSFRVGVFETVDQAEQWLLA